MRSRNVALAGVVASVALALLVSALTNTAAYVELTPVTVAIYLLVGVAVPQYVISRQTGSATSLGLAAFAAAGGTLALGAGALTVGLMGTWGPDLIAVLLLVVVGSFLGEIGRAFLAGYRGASEAE